MSHAHEAQIKADSECPASLQAATHLPLAPPTPRPNTHTLPRCRARDEQKLVALAHASPDGSPVSAARPACPGHLTARTPYALTKSHAPVTPS
eukprot:1288959-Pleurochrysis_carterae.AAC.2